VKAVYPSGLKAMFGTTAFDWVTNAFSAVLLTSGYTYNAVHDNLDDITAGLRIATTVLTTKTIDATTGSLKAADVVWTAVPAGTSAVSVVVFRATGVESTSTLISFTNEGTGMPMLGWGGSAKWRWPSGVVLGP
jgi:hypothetical protein